MPVQRSTAPYAPTLVSPEANMTLVRRFFDELCNAKNQARILRTAEAIVAADHVYHDPVLPTIARGPEGIEQVIAFFRSACDDFRWTVDEMRAAGSDAVVTRWSGHGTHTAAVMRGDTTGRPVAVQGIWWHRLAASEELGGIAGEDVVFGPIHIVESWNIWDALGLVRHLGAAWSLMHASRSLRTDRGHREGVLEADTARPFNG